MKIVRAALILASLTVVAPAYGEGKRSNNIADRVTIHLERGIEFYAEKQYELAIVEFRAGFALDPRPDFLFALAQSERLSGDCPTAVIYYERFLATGPDADQGEAARVNMKRCTRALESGPNGRPLEPAEVVLAEAETAAAPPPLSRSSATIDRRQTRRDSPWYSDKVGTSLFAGAVVSFGLGVGFWVGKGAAEDDASAATRYDDYVAALDRARRDRTISLVTLSVGAALAGATIYRYTTRSPHSTRLVAAPTVRGGGAVSLIGSF